MQRQYKEEVGTESRVTLEYIRKTSNGLKRREEDKDGSGKGDEILLGETKIFEQSDNEIKVDSMMIHALERSSTLRG